MLGKSTKKASTPEDLSSSDDVIISEARIMIGCVALTDHATPHPPEVARKLHSGCSATQPFEFSIASPAAFNRKDLGRVITK